MTWTVFQGDYAKVLGPAVRDAGGANLILESPPYNIGSKAPRRDGQRRSGKFDPKSYGAVTGYEDNLPEEVYQRQQRDHFLWVADHLAPGGVFVYNHKPRRRNGAMIFPHQWFLDPYVQRVLTPMEEVVWDRGSTHNHGRGLMWPQTERLYVFRRSDSPYVIYQGPHLDYRSDIWKIPLKNRDATMTGHNVPMRQELADNAVRAWSKEGDLVVCPYTGSGTVGIAAVTQGRRFFGAELSPKYHTVAVERIAAAVQASRHGAPT